MRESSALISGIAEATSAQATSIREVNRAVEDLDKMNQHNTALVEETNASVEQAEFQTAELDRVIDLFTIEEAPEHDAPVAAPAVFARRARAR